MTTDQYRKRWIRRHKKYEQQAYGIFIAAFREMANKIPFDLLTESNYEIIVSSSITEPDLQNAYFDVYNKVGKQEGERTGQMLNKQIEQLSKEWTLSNFLSVWGRNLFEWILQNASSRVVTVKQNFTQYIVAIIANGLLEGKTLPEISKQIQEYINNPRKRINGKTFYRWEALRIARTETTAAANYASTVSGAISGVVTEKVWISSDDARVRRPPKSKFNHAAMDGVRVDYNDKFYVSGEFLSYPGDPNASAGNVINCRCSSAVVPKRDRNGNLIRTA